MKNFIIGSGWKMNNTIKDGLLLLDTIEQNLVGFNDFPIYVLPPFTALAAVGERLKESHIQFGAQNMHWETKGAYTGEIAAPMLNELGCTYVELNHHERRTAFGETNQTTNRKLHTALKYGLAPILCIGEEKQLTDRDEAVKLLTAQLSELLTGIERKDINKILFAYEPLWAIGKAAAASPGYINWIHGIVREILKELYDLAAANNCYILYGGSVNLENALAIAGEQEVNGLFIGRSGLDGAKFAKIILSVARMLKQEA